MIRSIPILAFSLVLSGMCTQPRSEELPVYETGETVVTTTRMPVSLSDIPRSVSVVTAAEIRESPAHSVQELLGYISGVDIRQRGPLGVQADVSIWGGTFEETLVLIDGVGSGDSQTGHHNLNIPLLLDDVERIEVLKGGASGLHGANAFGGVVNIVTKRGRARSATVTAAHGANGLVEGGLSFAHPVGASSHRLSVSGSQSDGYRYNTDFETSVASYTASLPLGSGALDVTAGYLDKEFGANGFYSERYPGQWERTTTVELGARYAFRVRRCSFRPAISWRRNRDVFALDRARPDWYRNRHLTDALSVSSYSTFESGLGRAVLAAEAGIDVIESSNLGGHSRSKLGFSIEQRVTLGQRLVLLPAASAYAYENWGWGFWPGMDAGFRLGRRTRLHATLGRSFRVPTFTDLYYSSPTNQGSPDLQPEEAWTYETGLGWFPSPVRVGLSVFRRKGRNLIDWVKAAKEDKWRSTNITRVSTDGLDASAELHPGRLAGYRLVPRLAARYTFLRSTKSSGEFISAYVLDHPRHQVLLDADNQWSKRLKQNWRFRIESRPGYERRLSLDSRLSCRLGRLDIYVDGTNLLNRSYMETRFVPGPGRWIRTGLRLDLCSSGER